MICPSCGAENPDHAFYCGKCAVELRPPPKPADQTELRYTIASMRGVKEPDAMVAVAINVRRIFILLGTTLALTLWTTWYSMFISEVFWVSEGAIFLFAIGATIIAGGGLWYAIKMKRVSTLQSQPILPHRDFS